MAPKPIVERSTNSTVRQSPTSGCQSPNPASGRPDINHGFSPITMQGVWSNINNGATGHYPSSYQR